MTRPRGFCHGRGAICDACGRSGRRVTCEASGALVSKIHHLNLRQGEREGVRRDDCGRTGDGRPVV